MTRGEAVLDPSIHARVKTLFATAVELRPAERARFLADSCGDDSAVRREVDSLLEHHFAESILKAMGTPALAVSNSAATGPQSHWYGFARRHVRLAAIAVAALCLLLLGWWTHARVYADMRRIRAAELQNTLASKTLALETWIQKEQDQMRMLAGDAEFREPALALIRMAEAGDAAIPALKSSAEREELIAYLATRLADLESVEIFDPRGFLVFAGSRNPRAGSQLNENGLALLARLITGETIFEKPYRSSTLFATPETGTMHTVVGAPIHGYDGRVDGAIIKTERAYGHFAELVAGRLGETGETYAFDREAVMLTPSPFAGELRQLGLLPRSEEPSREWDTNTQLNLRLRDPGRLLRADAPASKLGAALPLTRLASTALAHGAENDHTALVLEPYRNYRGAEVIGAWRWLPDYDLVLAAEMETVEAFAPLRYFNATFGILFGLLTLSVAAGLLGSFSATGLRRRLRALERLGQYRLLELIGEGGMGKVYLAEHAALKRRTAIKILSPELYSAEAVARFEREVMVSSQLTHPNTVDIYDYGRTADGVLYYAMEYVDGFSLAELVSRFGAVPAPRAVHLLVQICRSLKEAHSRGVVHRDIKPLNVMVCCRGGHCDVVKVLDFGLAKLEENAATGELTGPARVGGTLMYMAPERFTDARSVDARADIYSLAGVAYYLLAGKPPFEAVHDLDLIYKIARGRPRDLSEAATSSIPTELERLVMECLEKFPERRPASIDEVERRLHPIRSALRWSDDDARRWWSEHEKFCLSV